jgi:hypothetical protein
MQKLNETAIKFHIPYQKCGILAWYHILALPHWLLWMELFILAMTVYPLNLDHIMALRYPRITRQADKPLLHFVRDMQLL